MTRNRLAPGDIHWRASCVADGTATPDDARELISEFVRQARTGSLEPRLIEHVSDCFAAFLAEEKRLLPAPEAARSGVTPVRVATLEEAFGMIRAMRGRPDPDRDTSCIVAMEVLERMLSGETLEVALEFVAADRRAAALPISSETEVRETWAKYKSDGLLWLRISRLCDIDPSAPRWTPTEMERLTELFGGEPWFVPPGVDPKATWMHR
jgi:hypothetical protein